MFKRGRTEWSYDLSGKKAKSEPSPHGCPEYESRRQGIGCHTLVCAGNREKRSGLGGLRAGLGCRFLELGIELARIDPLFERAGVFAFDGHTERDAGPGDLFGGVLRIVRQ